MADSSRASSHPDFWNTRYEREDHLFGAAPNAFVTAAAHRLPPDSDVVEVRAAFGDEIVRCNAADVHFREGQLLNGHAAIARTVVHRAKED